MSDVLQRYQENTHLPDDVLKEHEREIKRFLAMCSAYPGSYGMRGPLDELWHTFIIFTSSYAKFCRDLGGEFVHHLPEPPKDKTPRDKDKTPGDNASKGSYMAFLKDYQRLIGEEPPRHLWPRPAGGNLASPSCGNCGELLLSDLCGHYSGAKRRALLISATPRHESAAHRQVPAY